MASKEQDHVMICYNWQHQTMAKRIKNELDHRGYKTWMDLNDMRGNINEVTANAIEAAGVVLLCVTRAFKESHNCKKETNYADETRKTIIPLKLEKNVVFDGWIGLIAGKEMRFDFSNPAMFNTTMNKLDAELALLGLKPGEGSQCSTCSMDTFDVEDVCHWLRGLKLTDKVISVFRENCVTGEELIEFTHEMLTGEDFGLTRYVAKKILDKRDQSYHGSTSGHQNPAKSSIKKGGIPTSVLIKASKEIPVKEWKFVGRELGLDDKTLDRIEKDNRDNVLEQVYKMLQQWSDSTPGASEQVLQDVLTRMEIYTKEDTEATTTGISPSKQDTGTKPKVKTESSTSKPAVGQTKTYQSRPAVGQAKVTKKPTTGLPQKGTINKFTGEGTQHGKLHYPRGLFHRNNGDFVLCDSENDRILVLDCELNCKSVSQFNSFDKSFYPIDVVVSNNDIFYITDFNNNSLVICTEKCKIIKVLQLTYKGKHIIPFAVCLSMGYIYITDWSNGCVYCIDGKSYKVIKSSHPLTDGWGLRSICVNTKGHFMISDYYNHCIHILDKDLNKLTTLTHQLLQTPKGLCLDQFDNLYVCEGNDEEGKLLKFNSQGEFVSQIADSEVYDPWSIVVTDDIIAWTEYETHCVKILYR
ncbi:uncharacterized protein LOC144440196 [Glandiceps talaboti]